MAPTHDRETGTDNLRLRYSDAFRNEAGAFDLPSILVGVVVVGILTAGVLAAIFGVIPFAQDKGAQQNLDAVRTAEGVAKAKDSSFVSTDTLASSKYLASPGKIAAGTDGNGSCYTAVSLSGSGKLFYAESGSPSPRELTTSEKPSCVTDTVLRSLIDQAGGDSSTRPAATPDAPVLTMFGSGSSWQGATWDTPARAETYRVEISANGGAWTTEIASTYNPSYQHFIGAGDTYLYRVYAVNASGESAASNVITAHVPGYTSTSVLTNSGFDSGETGWTITGGTHTINPVGWLGGWGNVVNAVGDVTISQSTPVSAGEKIMARFDIQSQQDDTHMYLRFFDASGVEIPGSVQDTVSIHDDNMVIRQAPEATAPAGAVTATLSVVVGPNDAWVDNVGMRVFR